ncbi:MAG: shikimate kinase [Endomicrobium sp.]|jgi:shikimate kinase|nr:shikimate kinase [Endomicrobium sp.]
MNLVFTGFMGTGKSQTGRIVSESLNKCFFDTDSLIEKEEGFSIDDIFLKYGEIYFRKIESKIIKKVSLKNSSVISCGGGVVLDSRNIVALRKNGIIINLYASAEVIYDRIVAKSDRPLLKCNDSLGEIKKLFAIRKNAYVNYDFAFNTDGLKAVEVADNILNKLKLINI